MFTFNEDVKLFLFVEFRPCSKNIDYFIWMIISWSLLLLISSSYLYHWVVLLLEWSLLQSRCELSLLWCDFVFYRSKWTLLNVAIKFLVCFNLTPAIFKHINNTYSLCLFSLAFKRFRNYRFCSVRSHLIWCPRSVKVFCWCPLYQLLSKIIISIVEIVINTFITFLHIVHIVVQEAIMMDVRGVIRD